MSTIEPTPENHQNNVRLRELIAQTGLTQVAALSLFNVGIQPKKYSLSVWKAYLADRTSMRWRRFDDELLAHAEKTLGRIMKAS